MYKPEDIPAFEGEFFMGGASLEEVAEDFGHLSHQRPGALLRPASAEDISKLLRFASVRGLRVSARGQGHSMDGQTLTEGGVVIDTRSLSRVRSLDEDSVWAEVGLTWADLNQHTLTRGRIVPSLTDHSGLSVGGLLSVGGISGQAFRFGAQVDTVLALEVVTVAGEVIECSLGHEREIFESCLGGLGQFAVITAARLTLIAAPERVRTYEALYASPEIFLDLQMSLCRGGRFDYVAGLAVPTPAGTWGFLVQASKFYRTARPPDDQELSALLQPRPAELTTIDRSLTEFLDRGAEQERALRGAGLWSVPHPWLTQFVSRQSALELLTATSSRLSPAEIGYGLLASYPLRSGPTQATFLCMPPTEERFLLGVLSSVLSPTPAKAQRLVEHKRALYTQGRALGAKLYPVGLLPQRGEWAEHYGDKWALFQERKRRFDPGHVLGVTIE